ncbi:putative Polyadenylate-binding protein [Blattamonas nauphoetae]|uniref:Polyadenylate-binding protein n=1 Tax=Blattamonas nauphoetae TaxID=2049346 RepID=A0ABQ9YE99_9EUKA|nr:putative Polyadenylate-binding protein [Blattamonas nauphoetae]
MNQDPNQGNSSLFEQLRKMNAEAKEVENIQANMDAVDPLPQQNTETEKRDMDARSIFVGDVEASVKEEDLALLFSECGAIEKVTIKKDRDGNSKGFAYIAFIDPGSVDIAIEKANGYELKGRALKVNHKRTNLPGMRKRQFNQYNMPFGMFGGRNQQPIMIINPSALRGIGMYPRGRGTYRGSFRGGRGRGRGQEMGMMNQNMMPNQNGMMMQQGPSMIQEPVQQQPFFQTPPQQQFQPNPQ